MSAMKIFAPRMPLNARLNKILVAAKFAGVEVGYADNFEMGVTNESEPYLLNCHPIGRTPVLQTEEGYLFESNAILRYIGRLDKSNQFIYGRTNYEAAQCDMWLDYAASEVDTPGALFLHQAVFHHEYSETAIKEAIDKSKEALCGLERWLETRTYLVGERITIADIGMAFELDWMLRYAPNSQELFKPYRNVWRFYNTVMNQPKTVEALMSVGAEIGIAKPKEAKAEKPKEAKAEKPKEAKAEKPKKEAADDDDEEETHEEPKKKNPLDLLPPSPFVLDAFKREYSNKDTRTEAAPWFFANYDPQGFSCFYSRYKYNDELKMQFMTANLIRGWFQRMEGNRKYAFGSVLIVGEEKKHEIIGFWIFRGHGVPESVLEVEDTELFEWALIPDVKADAAKITDMLAWEGPTLGGKAVLEGRAFKQAKGRKELSF